MDNTAFGRSKITILRVILWIAIFAVSGLGILLHTSKSKVNIYDPISLRVSVIIISIALLIATYRFDMTKKSLDNSWLFVVSLYCSWTLYLTFLNSLHTFFFGLSAIFIASTLGFQNRKHTRNFVILFAAATFLVVYLSDNSLEAQTLFAFKFLVLAAITFFISDTFTKAQERLVHTNSYLEVLLDNSVPCILFDENGDIVKYNQEAIKHVKENMKEDITTMNSFVESLPEHNKADFRKGFKKALKGERVEIVDRTNNLSAKGYHWLHIKYLPVQYEGGRGVIFSVQDITSSKEREQALIEQNTFIKQLVDSSPFGVFSYDVKSDGITWVNQNLFHKFGYQEAGFKGEDVLTICHYQDQKEYQNTILSATIFETLGSEETDEIASRIYTKDGNWAWIQSRAKILSKNSDGTVRETLVFYQDITKKKKQELQLARLSMVASSSKDSVIITNKEGSIEWVNNGFTKMTGYASNDVIGKEAISLFQGPNVNNDTIIKIQKQILAGKNFALNTLNYRKNGATFWNETSIQFIRDEKGNVTGYFARQIDITEKKAIWENIQKSEHEFRSLFEKSPIGMIIINLEGTILQANKGFSNLLGYDEKELLDADALKLLHLDDQEDSKIQDVSLLKGQISLVEMERRYIHKKGHTIQVIAHIILLKDYEGSPETFFVQLLDITAIKKSQELLSVKNQELEKANKELDSIIYSAAHDLRAPLTSVLGLVDLSTDENEVDVLQHHIEMIGRSVTKLDGFVTDIVLYSRNTRAELKFSDVNLKEVIEEIFEQHAFIKNAKQISQIFDLKVNNAEAFCTDFFRLNVIFNNLIGNAIRYHDLKKEAPTIKVVAEINEKMAVIKVIDNGFGIDKKFQNRVFEMFFRASNASAGTGLGLYIVKEAVKKIGGKISLQSEIGKGTTFEVHIPNQQQFIIPKKKKSDFNTGFDSKDFRPTI